MGEVFENENGFGAGVVELMCQFIGRVQRVNIGHRIARAQNRRYQNQVLQTVGHHDGDTVAFLQAEALQPRGDVARILVKFAVGQRFAHIDRHRAVAKARKCRVKNSGNGIETVQVDVFGYAGVLAQPRLLHEGLQSFYINRLSIKMMQALRNICCYFT